MEVNLMKTLLTLHEAARLVQGVPRDIPGRLSRRMPDVVRTHKELARAARLYEDTEGAQGLPTIVEGTRKRRVYETDLTRYILTKEGKSRDAH
jgi:hypothetical protein